MSDIEAELRREIAALRQQLADANRSVDATPRGGVDTVAAHESGTPVLPHTAHEELRSNRALLGAVFDGSLDALLLADDRGVYVDANRAACELFGLPRDQLVGRRVGELTLQNYAGSSFQAFVSAGQHRGQFPLGRPDGTSRVLEFGAVANVSPGLHLSAMRDVTDRVAAEDALRRSEARFRAMIEKGQDGISLLGADLRQHYQSPAVERLLGYRADEAEQMSWQEFVDEEERPKLARALAELMKGPGATASVEFRIRKRDGSRSWLELTATNWLDDPDIGAIVTNFRDITEQRRASEALRKSEERLRQAQKMEAIGNLAGGIAHDFNNLLSVILSYTSLIIDDLQPTDPLKRDLDEVHRAGLRATEMTRQLLAFSRKQILQPSVVDVTVVLEGIEKMLGRLVGEDIELALHTATAVGKIFVDPSQLEQVIMNLVVNARDAMPDGGNITIETSSVALDEEYAAVHAGVTPGAYVLLAVTDTGVGMDRATQERIYEPFFTTKEKGKGTGLGLSTVYGIVQQSGGHIWVYSELGHGTTFKLYFPRTDRVDEGATPQLPPGDSLRGSETILLVEDEDPVRQVVKFILRKSGYNVLEAQNGGEAFLLCEQFAAKIHLLLTDVVMPRMSGRQLATRLAAVRPEMKVLYVSGYTEDTIVHHGVLDAGVEFLAKPILPEPLLRKVRQVLDAPPRGSSLPPK